MSKNFCKNFLIAAICLAAVIFAGFTGNAGSSVAEQEDVIKLSREEIKSLPFDDLFKSIDPREISESVFTLVGSDYAVLTAGNPSHYNTMLASWAGFGMLFNAPVVSTFLRSNRYTLELMLKEQKFTMKFFDREFRNDIMPFGMSSGRDSDEKMRNTLLTAVPTPAGNMVFKEAKLIIECDLFQVTTVSPDDFYVETTRQLIIDSHAETNDYHKIVYGRITNVWVRK